MNAPTNPATGRTFNPSPGFIRLTEAMFAAKAYEELMSEKVRGYQTRILAENDFRVEPSMRGRLDPANERIVDPKLSYLMGDEAFQRYHDLCDEARKAAGLKIQREGGCPLLEAEHIRMQAENEFLKHLAEETKMPQLAEVHAQRRTEVLDLGMKLMAPFVDAKETMRRLGAPEDSLPEGEEVEHEGPRP